MKFIVGLLIGGCLVFGWHYMIGASKAELNQEREKAKATLEEVKKADAETLAAALTAEKAKIRADYEVQLKAAENQVRSLNTELLKTRTDLVTAQAKLANMVETVKVVEKPVSKPVVVAPVSPVPSSVSVPPSVAQPAPTQPAQVAPVKSSFGGPRPSPSGVSYQNGYYREGYGYYYDGYWRATARSTGLHTKMDGTTVRDR